MFKINPLGRKIENGLAGNFEITPRACQCSDWDQFTSYKGKYDDCEHCGCGCNSSTYQAGNRNGADAAPYAS